MSLLELAAVCVVETLAVSVQPTPTGWLEEASAVVVATGDCDTVDVVLPQGVHLREHDARVKFSDGVKSKLPTSRWTLESRGLDDIGVARLHVPELVRGDRVRLRFTLEHTQGGAYRFEPEGALYAELQAPKKGLTFASVAMERDGSQFWASKPGPDAVVYLKTGDTPPVAAVTEQNGLSALDALTAATGLTLIPRGVDGAEPVSGDAALARGAADDRGFARTVVALAKGGPDTVGLGEIDGREVALWADAETSMPLAHPGNMDVGPEPVVGLVHTEIIDAPPGDVQRLLYPGGGATTYVQQQYSFGAHPVARAFWVEMPRDRAEVEVAIEPASSGVTWRERVDGLALVLPPAAAAVQLTVGWTQPDAATHGEAPQPPPGVRLDGYDVVAREGVLGWETRLDAWWLKELNLQTVIPGREPLTKALERRFLDMSIPEPALPLYLKRKESGWDLAEQLRPALWERAQVAELPGDPLFPRRLVKARKSRVVTPVEAALILRLQLVQARMQAGWALVRPTTAGPGGDTSLAGYTHALVRVHWQDEERWIDPGCTVCAPFEIRTEFLDVPAIGPGVERTPFVRGVWRVGRSDGEITWALEGPAALELRRWLQPIPGEDRTAALARRMAGPGAELVSHEGLSEAGAPITLVARGGTGEGAMDLMDLIEVQPDGSAHVPWRGRIRLPASGPPGELDTVSLTWKRTKNAEVVGFRSRRISPADLARLAEARAATPEPELAPLPAEHPSHGPAMGSGNTSTPPDAQP